MRFLIIALASIAFSTVASGNADRSTNISWGKAGVSMDDYVRDSRECAETSRYVTAYIKPETLKQLDALSSARLLDTVMQIGQVGTTNMMGIVDAIGKLRSADDIARRTNTFGAKYVAMVSFDVRDQLQAVLDRCLVERGYSRIRLTDLQARTLRHLKRHSPERTAYLHSIDSDATVVAQQRLVPAS